MLLLSEEGEELSLHIGVKHGAFKLTKFTVGKHFAASLDDPSLGINSVFVQFTQAIHVGRDETLICTLCLLMILYMDHGDNKIGTVTGIVIVHRTRFIYV